jgi:hypothetical protein
MATTITAGNSTNGAAAIAPDNTGILELKTGSGAGTTAMTIGTGQQVAVTLGSAAAPAITFAGDTNTGIYSPAADTIAFAEGGTEAMRINSDAQVVTVAGTASLPALTFTGDTNTGIFSPAADTIAFAEGGTEAVRINSDAQVVTLAGTAALPVLTFTGDVNTGIYSPGADRIGFTEGGTQVGEFDASGNFLFNSGYGSVATAYGCRAWVNFNGTTNVGGFCTIRGSGNVTSVADNATGNYTVNFTNAMPDTNYATLTAGNGSTQADPATTNTLIGTCSNTTQNTTSCTIKNLYGPGGTAYDIAKICVAIFR